MTCAGDLIWASAGRLARPAKTQIRQRIRAVWSESSLIACAFYNFRDNQRGMNENPCHTWWMYRLIWVFAGHTGLTVGFHLRWLIRDKHFTREFHTHHKHLESYIWASREDYWSSSWVMGSAVFHSLKSFRHQIVQGTCSEFSINTTRSYSILS